MIDIKGLSKTLLVCLAMSLSACSTLNPTSRGILAGAAVGAMIGGAATLEAGAPLGAAVGGLAGGLLANLSTQQKTLLQVLQQDKVKIIEVGDELSLIIPAEQLFNPCAPSFNAQSARILNHVALFLRSYPKIDVSVKAYTDKLGSSQRNVALSRQRAQATASYLWSQHIDSRLLYSEGKGSANPIAASGQQANNRIEISFQGVAE